MMRNGFRGLLIGVEITLSVKWGSIYKSLFSPWSYPPKFQGSMTKISNPTTHDLLSFSREDLTAYIFSLQDDLQNQLESGLTMDDILDQKDPFEILEPILPQEVYPILVLAMINNIRSETVIEAIMDGFEKGIKDYQTNLENTNE
tara:strand:- start:900 stop:1334 length:435 start_codon:yes stop_codon:yes gene_type:complete